MTDSIFKDFGDDPVELFRKWFDEAKASEPNDPNAMALATVDSDGRPAVRIVLLKDLKPEGFVFHTNYESAKGRALLAHPQTELNFYWKSLGKQIRIAGSAVQITAAESDAYFASRPRESQLGAWASAQSRPMDTYETFESNLNTMRDQFANQPIPRPPHWGGFCVRPESIEFWIAHPYRLHTRFVYKRLNNGWDAHWLYP